MTRLKLLFVISNEGQEEKLKDIYRKNDIKLKTVTYGIGTASPSLLDYFGLIETKKHINLAIIPDYAEDKILNQISKSLNIVNPGTGITFTVPIMSANKFLLDGFEDKEDEKKVDNMNEKNKYYLIITIVLEGHLNKVMDAAKRMGAQGGTVIRGRGLGNKEAVKLFGFEIEPGRELVLNIVEDKIKNKVMEEITKEVGIKTPGKGVCIALPVDTAIGIN